MTLERIEELRQIALKHQGKRKCADYMLELIAYTDELRELYKLALTFGWSPPREKHIAFSQLVKLAER